MAVLSIICDYREQAVIEALRASEGCAPPRTARLDVGDFHLMTDAGGAAPAVMIERKSWADLASSLSDGRWREQKQRLLAEAERCGASLLIALEGPGGFFPDEQLAAFGHSRITPKHVRGALSCMLLRDQIPVIRTRDAAETAAMLRDLAGRGAAVADRRPLKRLRGDAGENAGDEALLAAVGSMLHGSKRKNKTPRAGYLAMISCLHGISPKTAKIIGDSFVNMRELADASVAQMADVQCGKRRLGDKAAKTIYDALRAEK